MTAIRSLIVSASSWSWVTYTNVIPTSDWTRFSSIWSCLRSFRSSAPSGSSSRRTLGRFTSARASATRCCWPPLSWLGLRSIEPGEMDELQRLRHPALDLVLLDVLPAQPERDVLADVEVGEQRVVLEDHVDRALVRRVVGHVAAAELDPAAGRQLEATDHPEGRGLAAAGRPEQREELTGSDVEGHVVDRSDVAKVLRQIGQTDLGGAVCALGHEAASLGVGPERRAGRPGARNVTAGL